MFEGESNTRNILQRQYFCRCIIPEHHLEWPQNNILNEQYFYIAIHLEACDENDHVQVSQIPKIFYQIWPWCPF